MIELTFFLPGIRWLPWLSQNPTSRFRFAIQNIVPARTTNPVASSRRGSTRPTSIPTTGIARNDPSPRGAIA